MNTIDKQYLNLLEDILNNGFEKDTRSGKVISVFGRQIRHKMSEGFPLLTTKKMYFKGIITELLWFLRGDTNIRHLIDNDCHIWDGDAYKKYEKLIPNQHVCVGDSDPMNQCMIYKRKICPISGYPILERLSKEEFIDKIKIDDDFARKWGELGPVYGKQWREWSKYDKAIPDNPYDYEYRASFNGPIDQIQNLINDLKTDPYSRRLMVNAWNVAEIDEMTLPPCHYGFQVYTRDLSGLERWALCKNEVDVDDADLYSKLDKLNIPTRAISLMWNQRSVDTPLGLPFNIASYALLLEILAKMVNMVPEELIGNLGDTHIYQNQIDGIKEQLKRTPYELPNLKISNNVVFNGDIDDMLKSCDKDDFTIENYQSHASIKMPLSN